MAITSRFLPGCTLLLVLAVACGEESSPVDGGPPPDTTPPTVSTVTAVDNAHVDVVFNEAVSRATAENPNHYLLTETGTPVSGALAWTTPGDTIVVRAAVLRPDQKTVTLTTGLLEPLNVNIAIHGVSDTDGNVIVTPVERLFPGSLESDVTAPEIVRSFPAPGATGVAVGFPVRVQFSEPIYTSPGSPYSPVFELSKAGSPVAALVAQFDATTWELNPVDLLEYGAEYTVDVSASDGSNIMTPVQWTFRTTSTIDVTPPRLVSTAPSNLSVNVDVNASLSATFSEPMDQEYSLMVLTPNPGGGTVTWSEDGKTVTFEPDAALLENQQYTFVIHPGDVRDLAGNEITRLYTVVFTTGSALEKGTISGTLTGDAGSPAADPTGAVVLAVDAPFDPGPFNVLGSAVTAANNTYSVLRLADGAYYLIATLDTNSDGRLEPASGDAIGAYGIDSWPAAQGPDAVTIFGGSRAININFAIFDPSAVHGTVTYGGAHAGGTWVAHIALYDTTAYKPSNAPVVNVLAGWPATPDWEMLSIDEGFADGVYYAFAYLDVNENGTYEPATDPAGVHGGSATPTPLNVINGADFTDVVIPLVDPVAPGGTAVSLSWPAPGHSPVFQLIQEIARRGLTAK